MQQIGITRKQYLEGALRTLLAPDQEGGLQSLLERDDVDPATLYEVLRKNLVLVRALDACDISNSPKATDIQTSLDREKARIQTGVVAIQRLATELDQAEIRYAIIKTLDQFPDMGHDIDFLVLDQVGAIARILVDGMGGEIKSRTLSERLAQKTNYRLPGHPTLEQHHERLGQVGEEKSLVDELMKNVTTVDLEGTSIKIPSLEFRILLAVLQRILRHFNIRLCDLVNMHDIVESGRVDWDYLFDFSRQQGLYRAVAYYLAFIEALHRQYLGSGLLPKKVADRATAIAGAHTVRIERDHFRFPMWKVGPSVYTAKYLGYLRRFEIGAAMRLSIVPAFALFTYSNIKFFPRWPVWKRIW